MVLDAFLDSLIGHHEHLDLSCSLHSDVYPNDGINHGLLFLHSGLRQHPTTFLDATQPVRLISGMTAKKETCLAAPLGGGVEADTCVQAVGKKDGRDVFLLQEDGQINSMAQGGGGCVVLKHDKLRKPNDPWPLEIGSCDERGTGSETSRLKFEVMPDNQLHVSNPHLSGGPNCLSFSGSGPGQGIQDVGKNAVASATATYDADIHGPDRALDGLDYSYWAGAAASDEPVVLTAHLDAPKILRGIDIHWEYAAKSFAVQTSFDGPDWNTIFKTTGNKKMKNHIDIQLGDHKVVGVRVVMWQPLQKLGKSGNMYAIRKFMINVPKLEPIIEPCPDATGHRDARDKWFLNWVSEWNPCNRVEGDEGPLLPSGDIPPDTTMTTKEQEESHKDPTEDENAPEDLPNGADEA